MASENHLIPSRFKYLVLLILAALVGCQSVPHTGSLGRFEFSEPHMGTVFSITLYAADQANAQAAAQAAFQRVAELERIMTDYDPRSELRQLYLHQVGDPVRVSPELFFIIKESQRVARETGGAYDITVGPYVHAWRAARKSGVLPSAGQLAAFGNQSDTKNSASTPAHGPSRCCLLTWNWTLAGLARDTLPMKPSPSCGA